MVFDNESPATWDCIPDSIAERSSWSGIWCPHGVWRLLSRLYLGWAFLWPERAWEAPLIGRLVRLGLQIKVVGSCRFDGGEPTDPWP